MESDGGLTPGVLERGGSVAPQPSHGGAKVGAASSGGKRQRRAKATAASQGAAAAATPRQAPAFGDGEGASRFASADAAMPAMAPSCAGGVHAAPASAWDPISSPLVAVATALPLPASSQTDRRSARGKGGDGDGGRATAKKPSSGHRTAGAHKVRKSFRMCADSVLVDRDGARYELRPYVNYKDGAEPCGNVMFCLRRALSLTLGIDGEKADGICDVHLNGCGVRGRLANTVAELLKRDDDMRALGVVPDQTALPPELVQPDPRLPRAHPEGEPDLARYAVVLWQWNHFYHVVKKIADDETIVGADLSARARRLLGPDPSGVWGLHKLNAKSAVADAKLATPLGATDGDASRRGAAPDRRARIRRDRAATAINAAAAVRDRSRNHGREKHPAAAFSRARSSRPKRQRPGSQPSAERPQPDSPFRSSSSSFRPDVPSHPARDPSRSPTDGSLPTTVSFSGAGQDASASDALLGGSQGRAARDPHAMRASPMKGAMREAFPHVVEPSDVVAHGTAPAEPAPITQARTAHAPTGPDGGAAAAPTGADDGGADQGSSASDAEYTTQGYRRFRASRMLDFDAVAHRDSPQQGRYGPGRPMGVLARNALLGNFGEDAAGRQDDDDDDIAGGRSAATTTHSATPHLFTFPNDSGSDSESMHGPCVDCGGCHDGGSHNQDDDCDRYGGDYDDDDRDEYIPMDAIHDGARAFDERERWAHFPLASSSHGPRVATGAPERHRRWQARDRTSHRRVHSRGSSIHGHGANMALGPRTSPGRSVPSSAERDGGWRECRFSSDCDHDDDDSDDNDDNDDYYDDDDYGDRDCDDKVHQDKNGRRSWRSRCRMDGRGDRPRRVSPSGPRWERWSGRSKPSPSSSSRRDGDPGRRHRDRPSHRRFRQPSPSMADWRCDERHTEPIRATVPAGGAPLSSARGPASAAVPEEGRRPAPLAGAARRPERTGGKTKPCPQCASDPFPKGGHARGSARSHGRPCGWNGVRYDQFGDYDGEDAHDDDDDDDDDPSHWNSGWGRHPLPGREDVRRDGRRRPDQCAHTADAVPQEDEWTYDDTPEEKDFRGERQRRRPLRRSDPRWRRPRSLDSEGGAPRTRFAHGGNYAGTRKRCGGRCAGDRRPLARTAPASSGSRGRKKATGGPYGPPVPEARDGGIEKRGSSGRDRWTPLDAAWDMAPKRPTTDPDAGGPGPVATCRAGSTRPSPSPASGCHDASPHPHSSAWRPPPPSPQPKRAPSPLPPKRTSSSSLQTPDRTKRRRIESRLDIFQTIRDLQSQIKNRTGRRSERNSEQRLQTLEEAWGHVRVNESDVGLSLVPGPPPHRDEDAADERWAMRLRALDTFGGLRGTLACALVERYVHVVGPMPPVAPLPRSELFRMRPKLGTDAVGLGTYVMAMPLVEELRMPSVMRRDTFTHTLPDALSENTRFNVHTVSLTPDEARALDVRRSDSHAGLIHVDLYAFADLECAFRALAGARVKTATSRVVAAFYHSSMWRQMRQIVGALNDWHRSLLAPADAVRLAAGGHGLWPGLDDPGDGFHPAAVRTPSGLACRRGGGGGGADAPSWPRQPISDPVFRAVPNAPSHVLEGAVDPATGPLGRGGADDAGPCHRIGTRTDDGSGTHGHQDSDHLLESRDLRIHTAPTAALVTAAPSPARAETTFAPAEGPGEAATVPASLRLATAIVSDPVRPPASAPHAGGIHLDDPMPEWGPALASCEGAPHLHPFPKEGDASVIAARGHGLASAQLVPVRSLWPTVGPRVDGNAAAERMATMPDATGATHVQDHGSGAGGEHVEQDAAPASAFDGTDLQSDNNMVYSYYEDGMASPDNESNLAWLANMLEQEGPSDEAR